MQSNDGKLHADLLWRHSGSADQIIGSADSTRAAGKPDTIDAMLTGQAIPAVCGDLLVLRVQAVSGSTFYIELTTQIDVP